MDRRSLSAQIVLTSVGFRVRRPGRSSYGRCRRRWTRRSSCASRPRPRGSSATWTTPPKWCAPGPLRSRARRRSSADAVQVEIRAAVAEVLESGNGSGKQWWRGGRGKENRSPRAAESPAAEGQEPVRNKPLPTESISALIMLLLAGTGGGSTAPLGRRRRRQWAVTQRRRRVHSGGWAPPGGRGRAWDPVHGHVHRIIPPSPRHARAA